MSKQDPELSKLRAELEGTTKAAIQLVELAKGIPPQLNEIKDRVTRMETAAGRGEMWTARAHSRAVNDAVAEINRLLLQMTLVRLTTDE